MTSKLRSALPGFHLRHSLTGQVLVYPLDYRSSFLCPTLVNPPLTRAWWLSATGYVAVLEPPPRRGGHQWLGNLPRHSAGVGIPHSHCQVTRSKAILAHSFPSPSSHGSAMARRGRKSLFPPKQTNLTGDRSLAQQTELDGAGPNIPMAYVVHKCPKGCKKMIRNASAVCFQWYLYLFNRGRVY